MGRRMEMTKDLASGLDRARSAEEVAELLKAAGMDEGVAGQLWNEISRHREDKELSLDELETVSGGREERDWLTDGCAATVEPNSMCWTNDGCIWRDVVYDHGPTNVNCPNCGAFMYVDWVDYDTRPSDDIVHYRCKNCGCTKII